MRAPSSPFAPSFPIRSLADVRRLEEQPLAQALPVRSTYEIFRNSAHAFGSKTALTFLPSADPRDTPIRWTYAGLLAGIHQTANLLHRLGVRPGEAVAVLLPGCLEYTSRYGAARRPASLGGYLRSMTRCLIEKTVQTAPAM